MKQGASWPGWPLLSPDQSAYSRPPPSMLRAGGRELSRLSLPARGPWRFRKPSHVYCLMASLRQQSRRVAPVPVGREPRPGDIENLPGPPVAFGAGRCPDFPETVLDFHSELGGLGAGRQNGELSPGGSERRCGSAKVSSGRATRAWPGAGPFLLGERTDRAPHLSVAGPTRERPGVPGGLSLQALGAPSSSLPSSLTWPPPPRAAICSGQVPAGIGCGWVRAPGLGRHGPGQAVLSFWPRFCHLRTESVVPRISRC